MSSQSELFVRKKRQANSQLSPENFHVSLFNAVLGGQPIVSNNNGTSRQPNQAYVEDEDESTDNRAEPETSAPKEDLTTSSEENHSSSVEPEPVCKKHAGRHICEKYKCLKTNDSKCLKYKRRESRSSESSEEDSTNLSSNSSSSSRLKSKKKKRKSSSSKSRNDTSSSDEDEPASSSKNDDSSEQKAESSQDSSSQSSRKHRGSNSKKDDETTSGEEDDGSGWTLSEDHQLRGMKEDSRNPTWAEIAQVLGRGKSEVKDRWKTIRDRPHRRDIDLDDDDNTDEDSTKSKQGKHDKTTSKKTDTTTEKSQKKHHSHTTADTSPNEPIILSGEEPSSDTDSDPTDLTYGPANRERRRQARYLHRHIYSELYPPSIAPKADEYFGSKDCEVLAAVESKWERTKWLEMQAGFYNVTGRMVPLSVIREKCEGAESEDGAMGKGGRGKGNVERWRKKVEQEDLYDPDS